LLLLSLSRCWLFLYCSSDVHGGGCVGIILKPLRWTAYSQLLESAMTTIQMQDHGKIPQKHLTGSLIHLSLEKLFPTECPGKWLVIDLAQSIVTLLSSSNASSLPARIWCHQPFTSGALRTLIALLRFPDVCPYAYLLAALQAPESLLISMLTEVSDPLPMSFYQRAEHANGLLQEATGRRREQQLRSLRRVMTDVIAGTKHMGLTVISLRAVGYRLQPLIHPGRSSQQEEYIWQ
jgi:hypothetical protein